MELVLPENSFTHLTKVAQDRENTNGMPDSGVISEGTLIVRLEISPCGNGVDEQRLVVNNINGYRVITSIVRSITPIDKGFSIKTNNSTYELTNET